MTISYGAYLAHHGKKGQKWGVQNGPPYPLKYEDLSPEERAEAKKTAIRDGNVSEVNANKSYFSDNEIDAVIKRFNLNISLNDIDKSQIKSGLDKIENFANTAKRVSTILDNLSKGYDSVAKIYNALGNGNLPIISKKGNGNGKGDNAKKQNNSNITKDSTNNAELQKLKSELKTAQDKVSVLKIQNEIDDLNRLEKDLKNQKISNLENRIRKKNSGSSNPVVIGKIKD